VLESPLLLCLLQQPDSHPALHDLSTIDTFFLCCDMYSQVTGFGPFGLVICQPCLGSHRLNELAILTASPSPNSFKRNSPTIMSAIDITPANYDTQVNDPPTRGSPEAGNLHVRVITPALCLRLSSILGPESGRDNCGLFIPKPGHNIHECTYL
jgi:hypothetical protein